MRTAYLWLIATLLIAPFIVVFGVSVGPSRNITFPPEGVSVVWYQELLTQADWLAAIGRSLFIAVCAGLIATVLALAINYVLWRTKSGFAKATFARQDQRDPCSAKVFVGFWVGEFAFDPRKNLFTFAQGRHDFDGLFDRPPRPGVILQNRVKVLFGLLHLLLLLSDSHPSRDDSWVLIATWQVLHQRGGFVPAILFGQ